MQLKNSRYRPHADFLIIKYLAAEPVHRLSSLIFSSISNKNPIRFDDSFETETKTKKPQQK